MTVLFALLSAPAGGQSDEASFAFVPVPDDDAACPLASDATMLVVDDCVGEIRIDPDAATCGGATIHGDFAEHLVVLTDDQDDVWYGHAPVGLTGEVTRVHLATRFDEWMPGGSVTCCATRQGDTLKLDQDCAGADPTTQRFCIYQARP